MLDFSEQTGRRLMVIALVVLGAGFGFIGNLMTMDLPWARSEVDGVRHYSSTETYRVASSEEARDLLPWTVRTRGTMAFVQLVPDDSGYVKVMFTRDKRLMEAISAHAVENGEWPEVYIVAMVTETRHALLLGDIFRSSSVIRNHVVRVDGNAGTVNTIMQWYNSRPASAIRT
ncbi:MAG: hypothetical protein UY26_C0003G0079 [Candidatus Jorgensenbacteria bacterium GW2011_GWA1_48_13]|uniref:Uncharacterized protein n=1 Tax=Candidatus Jorgensenbacteria bacterium GW2011_GWB1_50_10 TaxID=1618665 RepID=A0A0G1W8U1_9BACT|nr:MAG: hypothetical protein UY26_C0003G0079 [Candidatus Jorgensenbacteria bacterium GW2011_GWA1_48_13]KKW15040.1 MAG: hypothetical protein UY55_C0002G0096 [Candidatus Jorgensenbacteria bacterium GW2011_GWB1_50_10]